MGLRVNIYRSGYDSPLNVFFGRYAVTVTNVDGPFEPSENEPAALIVRNARGTYIVPADSPSGLLGPMNGGTFAASSDSRFRDFVDLYGAIPVHDRFETPEQYRNLSS